MAVLTDPIDLLDDWPGTFTLTLGFRQELAPERGGQQNSADLGPALWEGVGQSKELKASEFRKWQTRLHALEDGARTFKGFDKTACYPLAHPNGSWPTGASFNGIGLVNDVDTATWKQLKLEGLPLGFDVSEGDFVSILHGGIRHLYQFMASDQVGGAGMTAFIEVIPHVRNVGTIIGQNALLKKPYAHMQLIPGSVKASYSLNSRGTISFQARQTLSST